MAATIDFGIDLGTTNSSVALCRGGEVRVFQTTNLMNVTPSVVYVSRGGRMLVGKKAYDAWPADPENTQAEFKRWMGYSDRLKFPASGRDLSAEELSAEVLKSLRADAERATQERVEAAVITVPAAFGSLQCDATGRAARLAGLELAPLLQEPIAAAIAYGASPASRDQRWMVFDLGGGTLDIAVVSTRNDGLAVLEHQGNNRLGGKDLDRLIAEALLLKPLGEGFRLPDPKSDARAHQRIMRALLRHAEQAKIALSTAEEEVVELFDVGDDADGKPIEATLTLTRAQLESTVRPVIDQCLSLARRALEGARLTGADLDRVLLVGGPTQMPVVRSALSAELGAKLDHSLDPMTVVAHGAALYASTLDRGSRVAETTAAANVPSASPPYEADQRDGPVKIELAYERASGSEQSPVAGVLSPTAGVSEVRIDAGGGVWTSGWIPVVDGVFQAEVRLHRARPVTRFSIAARDARGGAVAVVPGEFTITFMLPMAAPPLPHTIAVELSSAHGVSKFDPVFERHCPLPAEARKTYKADRTLRPSDVEATLPIKFWEVAVSDDPQEKWWAGSVRISAGRIKRPIPEGSDLELTVRIDTSRKITVEVFVPVLNQSIVDEVYVPDPPSARSQLQQQLDLCFERLAYARGVIYDTDREDLIPTFDALESRAEAIAESVAEQDERGGGDPDAVLEPTEALRKLRVQLAALEGKLVMGSASPILAASLRRNLPYVEHTVRNHGTATEIAEIEKIVGQYERYVAADDARGLKWVSDQLWLLYNRVVEHKKWYWESWLEWLKEPGRNFQNTAEGVKFIAEADAAHLRDDLPAMRRACIRARNLTGSQLQAAWDQAAQSGLRGN